MLSLKLVAIAKDEAAYLSEWIYHHLSLGIKEIDIYLNGITDNSYQIMRKISVSDSRVNFICSDELLDICKMAKRSFQIKIYSHAMKHERRSRRFSHLLFLDLDEYLMPSVFGQKVDRLLADHGTVDVISLLWHSDIPCLKRKPFEFLLKTDNPMKKMVQMKSICRLNGLARDSNIHNFHFRKKDDSKKQITLSDGSTPVLNEKGKRIVVTDLMRLSGRFEPWFVYHCIFRSHDEYCVRLSTGNIHRNDQNMLKYNRYGYCTTGRSGVDLDRFYGEIISYQVSAIQLSIYRLGYFSYVRRIGLNSYIKKAQKDFLKRYEKLAKKLKLNPQICRRYQRQLRGTHFSVEID